MHKRPTPTNRRTQSIHIQKPFDCFGGMHRVLAHQLFFLLFLFLSDSRYTRPQKAIFAYSFGAETKHTTQSAGDMDLQPKSLEVLLQGLAFVVGAQVGDGVLEDEVELPFERQEGADLGVATGLSGSGVRSAGDGAFAGPVEDDEADAEDGFCEGVFRWVGRAGRGKVPLSAEHVVVKDGGGCDGWSVVGEGEKGVLPDYHAPVMARGLATECPDEKRMTNQR